MFTGINVLQAWRLVVERRPVKLTAEEDEVRRMVFSDLPPRKVLQVLSIASWMTAAPGERLIEHGKPVEYISLLVSGKAQVAKDDHVLGQLGAGDLVGSALLMTGAVAEVDALTVEPARIVRWEAATLERHLNADPETRNQFQRHLAQDLAGKVQRLGTDVSRRATPHPPSPNADTTGMS